VVGHGQIGSGPLTRRPTGIKKYISAMSSHTRPRTTSWQPCRNLVGHLRRHRDADDHPEVECASEPAPRICARIGGIPRSRPSRPAKDISRNSVSAKSVRIPLSIEERWRIPGIPQTMHTHPSNTAVPQIVVGAAARSERDRRAVRAGPAAGRGTSGVKRTTPPPGLHWIPSRAQGEQRHQYEEMRM
jgi:hypothetical protein